MYIAQVKVLFSAEHFNHTIKSLFTPHINYGSLLWGQAGGNLDKL